MCSESISLHRLLNRMDDFVRAEVFIKWGLLANNQNVTNVSSKSVLVF